MLYNLDQHLQLAGPKLLVSPPLKHVACWTIPSFARDFPIQIQTSSLVSGISQPAMVYQDFPHISPIISYEVASPSPFLAVYIPFHHHLVCGFNPSKRILVSWDDYSQYMEKYKS